MTAIRIYWSASEEAALIDKTAELIVQRRAVIKWDSRRIYGLANFLSEAQELVIDRTRHRPYIAALVQTLKRDVKARVEELSGQAAAPSEAPPSPPPLTVPAAPNRLGLDPKFSECLAYVCQEFSKALGEEMGRSLADKIREGVRDAMYDIRHHLGTAPGYVPPPAPVEPAPPPYQAVSALPQKFVKPKIAVLTLRGEQQQVILRQFPEIDFRFIDRASKHIGVVSGNCQMTFIMTKFIAHKDEAQVKGQIKRVNGGMTELARCIKMNFPNTRYAGLQEVRAA